MTTDLRNDTVMPTSAQELTERMLTMGCFSGLFAHYPVQLLRNHNRVRHLHFPLLALLVKMQAWHASHFHLVRVSTPQSQVPRISIP